MPRINANTHIYKPYKIQREASHEHNITEHLLQYRSFFCSLVVTMPHRKHTHVPLRLIIQNIGCNLMDSNS